MKRLFLLACLFMSGGALAATSVTSAGWQLITTADDNGPPIVVTSYDDCVAKLKALPAPAKSRTDYCREKWVTKVTKDPVPVCTSPKPATETRAGSCPADTVGTWTQSRAYVSADYPTCWAAGDWSPASAPAGTCSTPPVDPPPSTGGTFTDLASAPACAKVTIYPAKTVVDASAAGIPITAGKCVDATPATLATVYKAAACGDVITLRAGTYTAKWGEGDWYFAMGETWRKCPDGLPLAMVAAPGEAVVMKPSSRPALVFGNGDANRTSGGSRAAQSAANLTFAGFSIVAGTSCISGGGDTTLPAGGPEETGGKNMRLVAIDCTITDATSNTMTGLIDLQNDGWKILGVSLHDPANRVVINNNHGIYVQGGADNVEIAYSNFEEIHTGHVLQVHQDGAPKQYDGLWFHDNKFRGKNYGDMRGISVVNVSNTSTVLIERNTFTHLGQGSWGCLNLYTGNVTARDNSCTDTQGAFNLNGRDERGSSAPGPFIGTRKLVADGNKLCPLSGPPITLENNAKSSDYIVTNAKACP